MAVGFCIGEEGGVGSGMVRGGLESESPPWIMSMKCYWLYLLDLGNIKRLFKEYVSHLEKKSLGFLGMVEGCG